GGANLEHAQGEGAERQTGHAHLSEPAPEGIEQPVGGGMQQQAKLVGPEAMAAEAIGKAAVLEVVDPLLGFAAAHIPVVESQWGIETGREDEAGIGTL